jgi:hypothetical protein
MSRVNAYRNGALTEANPWQNFVFFLISIFPVDTRWISWGKKIRKPKCPLKWGGWLFKIPCPW